MDAPGRIGPYEIRGELGRGGMGVVYRAFRAELNREFALKCILEGGAVPGTTGATSADELVARFQREAESVARLGKHPNVVQVHDVGEDDGVHYLVMELVQGQPADELIQDEPLPFEAAARVARDMARGLEHAHAHGVLHRDCKPGNVMIDAEGNALLTDFGLARDVRTGNELTIAGTLLGTPEFMAPEQARSAENVTGQADIYAVGASLYQLVSGRTPHVGDSAVQVLSSLATREPPELVSLVPGCPPDLGAICHKALARETAERYATAGDLADDLDRFLRGEPTVARPLNAVTRFYRRARRRPALVASVVLGVLAIAAGAWGAAAWQESEEQAAGARASRRRAESEQRKAEEAAAASRRREEAERDRRRRVEEPYRRAVQLGLGPQGRRQRIELLNGVLEADPRYVPALVARAVTHAIGGELAAALADLDQAITVAPEDGDALWHRGRFHRDHTGDLRTAAADFERAAEVAPRSASGHASRAYLLASARKLDEAAAAVAAAEQAGASPAECHYLHGMIASRRGDVDTALERLLLASREDPHLMTAYYTRSRLLEDRGARAEAEAEIDRAIATVPHDYNAYFYRGRFRAHRRDYQGACEDYTRVLAGRPDHPQARVNRANALRRLRRYDEALADLDHAERIQPGLPQITPARADVYVAQGRTDEALAVYDRAIVRWPDRTTPRFNRASMLMNLGRPADALPDFEFVTEREPDFANAWFYRGMAEDRLERPAKALPMVQRATELAPRDWKTRRYLARLLEKLDRPGEAAAHYRVWHGLRPADGDAWLGRARSLRAIGKHDVAKGVLLQGLAHVEGTPDEARLRDALKQ